MSHTTFTCAPRRSSPIPRIRSMPGRSCLKRPNYSIKLSSAIRSSYRLGVCCPEYIALPTLGAMTTPQPVSIWLTPRWKLLRLQPDAGEVHLALAIYYYNGFREYGRARSELAIARRTLPNNADVFRYTGFIDRREGHWAEATRNIEHALELDPRNFFILQQLALTYQWQRRYADEARTYDRALTIVPSDPYCRIQRAQVALDWRADIKPFQTMLATLVAENPSVAPDVHFPLYALCERTAAAGTRTLTNY